MNVKKVISGVLMTILATIGGLTSVFAYSQTEKFSNPSPVTEPYMTRPEQIFVPEYTTLLSSIDWDFPTYKTVDTVIYDTATGDVITERYRQVVAKDDTSELIISPYFATDHSFIEVFKMRHYPISYHDKGQLLYEPNPFPTSALCYLEIDYGNGNIGYGSGAMVGKNAVLTAAHCLNDEDYGWAKSIKVIPGGLESGIESAYSTKLITNNIWLDTFDSDYDYGIIILDSDLGLTTGCFGVASYSDSSQLSQKKIIRQYGFPTDKTSDSPWHSEGNIVTVNARNFLTDTEAFEGQHGGPVVLLSNGIELTGMDTPQVAYSDMASYHIVGIHSNNMPEEGYNKICRITNEVLFFILNNINRG